MRRQVLGKEEDTRIALAVAVHGEEVLAATDSNLQVERGLLARLGPYWSCHPTRLADRNNFGGTSYNSLAETSWNIRGRVGRGGLGRHRLWNVGSGRGWSVGGCFGSAFSA